MFVNRERFACALVKLDGKDGKFERIADAKDLSNFNLGIMVSGGRAGDAYKSAEFFDLSTETWRLLASMKASRYGHGLAQINSRLT